MFGLFKSKPELKKLIPNNYVDIHSHLMFGIDDGAQTKDDTKTIIESMKSLGFEQAIATPHTTPLVWDNTKEGILAKYDEVLNVLPTEAESLQLRVASEYMMDESFLQRLQSEKLLTLKDNYVLVEMSYINPPIQLMDILFHLKSNGYEIVLAHPERYNFYHKNTEMYKKLKKAGCKFQMNLLSTTGYYGGHVLEAANYLLNNDMIDFVGSDIHHTKHIKGFEAKIQIKAVNNFEKAIANNVFFKK
ncbi:histidinol phosphatase [Myroides marinus]|jgi:tyrosine-protein phosphatase YwqE|uniref:protein-tyrosine-phosphatase n=1 Tax=Myroides marinus TaxID=703342 RepID=A0A161UQ63_9FLAO|nr:CpsB/CapC family capsule biosynthesis tyrosine phosphatase [Myroides marinus]MDR0194943.1 histidinol phosphatase [Myroides sp.]KUF47204.1 histidinol phosphatase [Myroides marinus]KZE79751.1 histidinol phosphatase [Myroides marinus]MDM1347711.1 histidinol phosphatase [Myroides marinus]MDM1351384.1 histidinol phosphatase [Myroides marinus]